MGLFTLIIVNGGDMETINSQTAYERCYSRDSDYSDWADYTRGVLDGSIRHLTIDKPIDR
jgi:hypothetical protein